MPSLPSSPSDLQGLFSERKQHYELAHSRMTTMVELAEEGIMPAEYTDYFPDGMHVHLPDHIRTAATDLSGNCSQRWARGPAPSAWSASA